ncbi:MAG: recombinase zinc beta ribbon domain-containing protein, partial [Anaerolineae bacterium]|nr:recombinase zinc beta ribbon domain-containing protein [Anaerolineae bacterium]
RLRDAINSRQHHILISYDNGRIARSESLFTYLAWLSIAAGMRVVTIMSGTIDATNADFAIPLAAMNAAGEIKRRVTMTDAAMNDRMDRGLHSHHVPGTHRVIRDERGKAVRLELRDDMRRFAADAAAVLLEGWGWQYFPRIMAEQYGHVNPRTGKWYTSGYFYRWFHNPYTWGYAARHYHHRLGIWAFDENAPLPDGVKINRRPTPLIPPVYTGELAERIKAELRRRHTVIKGHANPHRTYKFTGLMVCGECGRIMTIHRGRLWKGKIRLYWVCASRKAGLKKFPNPCVNSRQVREDQVQEHINDFLARLLARRTWDVTALLPKRQALHTRITDLQQEIAAVETQVQTMIMQQAKAPEAVQEYYTALIAKEADRLSVLKRNLEKALAQDESPAGQDTRKHAFHELEALGLERFWQQDNRTINQFLHRLMGKTRFVVRNGAIEDIK